MGDVGVQSSLCELEVLIIVRSVRFNTRVVKPCMYTPEGAYAQVVGNHGLPSPKNQVYCINSARRQKHSKIHSKPAQSHALVWPAMVVGKVGGCSAPVDAPHVH